MAKLLRQGFHTACWALAGHLAVARQPSTNKGSSQVCCSYCGLLPAHIALDSLQESKFFQIFANFGQWQQLFLYEHEISIFQGQLQTLAVTDTVSEFEVLEQFSMAQIKSCAEHQI